MHDRLIIKHNVLKHSSTSKNTEKAAEAEGEPPEKLALQLDSTNLLVQRHINNFMEEKLTSNTTATSYQSRQQTTEDATPKASAAAN